MTFHERRAARQAKRQERREARQERRSHTKNDSEDDAASVRSCSTGATARIPAMEAASRTRVTAAPPARTKVQ